MPIPGEAPCLQGRLQPLLPAPALGTRAEVGSLELRPPSLFPIQLFSLVLSSCFPGAWLGPGCGWGCRPWNVWVLVPNLGLTGLVGSSLEQGGTCQCRAPAATLPIIPKPAGAPPRRRVLLEGRLGDEQWKTSDRGALEALLFQRVGV